jgi:glycosyltransferase involved in cell wall biosynthesis
VSPDRIPPVDGLKRLRIAYVSARDPYDLDLWSGITHFMIGALEKHCGEVVYLGTFNTPLHFIGKAVNAILRPFSRRFNYGHSIPLARSYVKKTRRRLKGGSYDMIFTQGQMEIALLHTDVPIVFASDATFTGLREYYPYFSGVLPFSAKQSASIERSAFENSSLLLFASRWAAGHAHSDHSIEASKIHVVNFGANLDDPPDREKSIGRHTGKSKCRLLFVGVDWVRKGGPIAFETLLKLLDRGIDAELIVCGAVPPAGFEHKNMRVVPFLSKKTAEGRRKIAELYGEADFFFLPTRAESFGIVFCEAGAYGLPVISTDTGGVSSIITHGTNGFLLPLSAGAGEYAELIARIWNDESLYRRLVVSARDQYEERLNWDAWGRNVRRLVYETLGV